MHTAVQEHTGFVLSLHGFKQALVQIGAVDGEVRRPVAVHEVVAHGHLPQASAVQGITHLEVAGHKAALRQQVLQTPGVQTLHGVRAQANACAHLGEGLCLFNQLAGGAHMAQGQCSGQAAYAASGDQYISHAVMLANVNVRPHAT